MYALQCAAVFVLHHQCRPVSCWLAHAASVHVCVVRVRCVSPFCLTCCLHAELQLACSSPMSLMVFNLAAGPLTVCWNCASLSCVVDCVGVCICFCSPATPATLRAVLLAARLKEDLLLHMALMLWARLRSLGLVPSVWVVGGISDCGSCICTFIGLLLFGGAESVEWCTAQQVGR